ncbi:hypothetical protein AC233_26050 [Burkholderia sp. HB1]|jgi:hypothetical protein|nr:hypothetical protein AC233_26050 [Burkholderia sp. HB1]
MTHQELSDYAYDCDHVAPDSPEHDYRYVVKLVLRATLFFTDGYTPEARRALQACFEDYLAHFAKELKWGWDPQPASGKPTPWKLDDRLAEVAKDAFLSVKPDDSIVEGFASSLNPHYVGDYGIQCLTSAKWEQAVGQDTSYISFWVPYDAAHKGSWDGGSFPLHDFLLSCCNRLNVTQGYAGLAIALPHEYARWESYELELAQNYYGVEIDNPINVLGMIENWQGVKGANWYTILGKHYANKLGGGKAIRSKLPDPAFHAYDTSGGGVLIRAGKEPQMAPVEEGLPSLYVAVNDVIRPVRTTEIRSIGMGSNAGELRFNLRLTDLWMRRFDAPGIWPPAHP